MKNLGFYSDHELAMLFLNVEELYQELQYAISENLGFAYVKEIADRYYIYSPEQLEELETTFNDELNAK